jgi:enediyne biosynthesis protein E4
VADVNGNGHLDIFVTAYLDLEKKIDRPTNAFPTDYLGLMDRLYLNNGDGTFTDMAEAAGLTRPERGLGAIFTDLNNDGRLELYVANDGQPNRLYVNEPADNDLGFRFVEITEAADVGDANSGMGVAAGDYAGDGYKDLIVTNWENELNALYRNETAERNQLRFQYASFRIGISGLGNSMTGWGVHWLDVDHDTDLDLLIVNGYVPVTDLEEDAQLIRLYRNRTWETGDREELEGQFIEWTHEIGLSDIGPVLGRGSAVADFDNDGRLEIAIATIGGQALLLKTSGELGNWLKLDLQGATSRCPRCCHPAQRPRDGARSPRGQQLSGFRRPPPPFWPGRL